MPNLLHFEWEKDSGGYEIVEFDPRGVEWIPQEDLDWAVSVPKGTPIKKAKLIEKWGMKLSPPMDEDQRPFKIVEPVGKGIVRVMPLAHDMAPFMEFSELGSGEAQIVAFANKYGPLYRQPELERLDVWQSEIRRMRTAVKLLEKGKKSQNLDQWVAVFNRRIAGWVDEQGRVPMGIELKASNDPLRPFLHIVPDDFLSAMWLQLGQHVSASTQLQSCIWCTAWFVFGSGTNRRSSAQYCSDRCRKARHKASKRKNS